MPSYDPRELITRLNISRKYGVEMTKKNQELKNRYLELLKLYEELLRHFVCDECFCGGDH